MPVHEALFRVRDLSVTFPDESQPVVDRLSLDLNAGEIFAIVGESGSGKTMACMAFTRLIPKHAIVSGSVFLQDSPNLLGESEAQLRKVRGKKIAYVFQEPASAFNPVFSVGFQLREVLKKEIAQKENVDRRACELLDSVGFREPGKLLSSFPSEFSGGMLQRLAVAMALAQSPSVLVADEPTTALDASSRASLLRLLRRLTDTTGQAIIFITHDLGCLNGFADRILVMKKGQTLESGSVSKVLHSPENPETRKLLSAIPQIPSETFSGK